VGVLRAIRNVGALTYVSRSVERAALYGEELCSKI